MNRVSKRIRLQRKTKGLSQKDLAEACHVTQQAISEWEKGEIYPQMDRLNEIADALEIPIEALIYEDGEQLNYS